MIGFLPKTLEVEGKPYNIDSDFRTALLIMQMYNDRALSLYTKHITMLNMLFTVLDDDGKPVTIIPDNLDEAIHKAILFLDIGQEDNGKNEPKLIDYNKDEQLLFSAVNKIYTREVRAEKYMHWWTFFGLCQEVNDDSLISYIVSIRKKIASKESLDNHERKFYRENKDIIDIDHKEEVGASVNEIKRLAKSDYQAFLDALD